MLADEDVIRDNRMISHGYLDIGDKEAGPNDTRTNSAVKCFVHNNGC